MTKRKYKIFIRYTLLILSLFPLVLIMLNSIAEGANLNTIELNAIIDKFVISESFTAEIKTIIPSFGFELDGAFGDIVPITIANTMIIYIMYIALEVLLFIPKMAVEFLNWFNVGGKYE